MRSVLAPLYFKEFLKEWVARGEKLSENSCRGYKPIQVCFWIQCSNESSKSGWLRAELQKYSLAEEVVAIHLHVRRIDIRFDEMAAIHRDPLKRALGGHSRWSYLESELRTSLAEIVTIGSRIDQAITQHAPMKKRPTMSLVVRSNVTKIPIDGNKTVTSQCHSKKSIDRKNK